MLVQQGDAHPDAHLSLDVNGWRRRISGIDTSFAAIAVTFATNPVVAEALACDEQNDPARFRALHTQAVGVLAECLPAKELDFIAVLRRLADHYLRTDRADLGALLAAVRDVPLAAGVGTQWLRFYNALDLAFRSPCSEALAALNDLLNTSDLDEEVTGRALNVRAYYRHIANRPEEAAADSAKAVEIWRRRGDRLEEGKALLTCGILAYGLQEYADAEARLDAAARCFEATGATQFLAQARNEQGLVLRDLGRLPEALRNFEAAAEQCRAAGNRDYLGRALNNIGEVQFFQERVAEAAETFQEAMETMQTQEYRVDALLNLGLTRQAVGDFAGARAVFAEALDLTLTIERWDLAAEAHYRLGDTLRHLGQDQAALMQLEAAATNVEAAFEPIGSESLKISLLGRWQQIFEALVLHCLDIGQVQAAFTWAERARARAFGDALHDRRQVPTADPIDPQISDDRDGRRARESTDAITAPEMRAAIPAGTTILCYFTTGVLDRGLPLLQVLPAESPVRAVIATPARTILFVLTQADIAAHLCPIDPNILSQSLPGTSSRFLSLGVPRRLHRALLVPAGSALGARRIYVVPHGPLHHVPFNALEDRDGRPFVHSGGPAIAYAPSVTILLRHCLAAAPPRPAAPRACLAVGYNGTRLRYAEAEAVMVATLVGGEVITGPEAKRRSLLVDAGEQRWLHFACHAWFNEAMPLASRLETGDGETLTAGEVLRDWRLRAELVVLSACETGVAKVLRADEPMGLVRAFMVAGARAVVVSQWRVADLPAFLLMRRFYQGLMASDPPDPAGALHAAQLWLRTLSMSDLRAALGAGMSTGFSGDEAVALGSQSPDLCPFADPAHWAAYVMIGGHPEDPGNKTSTRSSAKEAIGTRSNAT